MKTADVVIIGKGPAGISCALYTHRAGFRTVVVGKDLGALAGAEKIENYYGLSSPTSGTELVLAGVEQARRLGIEVADDEVLSVEAGDGFTVSAVRKSYSARAVLLAPGKKRGAPKIKGLDRFTGRGVSYCAVCDGFFYRGKRLALLGNSRYAPVCLLYTSAAGRGPKPPDRPETPTDTRIRSPPPPAGSPPCRAPHR